MSDKMLEHASALAAYLDETVVEDGTVGSLAVLDALATFGYKLVENDSQLRLVSGLVEAVVIAMAVQGLTLATNGPASDRASELADYLNEEVLSEAETEDQVSAEDVMAGLILSGLRLDLDTDLESSSTLYQALAESVREAEASEEAAN